MADIAPFKGLRPQPHLAAQVAALPYDVATAEEARAHRDNEFSFLHVTRSEIDLAPFIDVHSQEVYDRAKENLTEMINRDVLIQDSDPCYYIYQLVMNGKAQTGLLCASSIEDYNKGIIKKHEFTRPEKELDRINHIKTTRAQTGVVFLAYKDVQELNTLIANWKSTHAPTYDFTADDGVQHTVWVVDDYAKVAMITTLFKEDVPWTYIADGHHRAASAAKVAEEFSSLENPVDGGHQFEYFLTCIFPESQLKIMDYNRVVKDLNDMSPDEFLERLAEDFDVQAAPGHEAYRPQQPLEFGLYLAGKWYRLLAKKGSFGTGPIDSLDVSILQNNVLTKLLNISDPRTNNRVEFVGGIRGLKALEEKVDTGEAAAAFACYPVSIAQLFAVADNGLMMPPKSTWFEPKTRDGLVVHLI